MMTALDPGGVTHPQEIIRECCKKLRDIIGHSRASVRTSAFLLGWKLIAIKDQLERDTTASADYIGPLVNEVKDLVAMHRIGGAI